MPDFLQTVADLIDERDREDLEATLARAVFELAEARTLTFWRVFRRVDGVWLRKRAVLPLRAKALAPREDDTLLSAAAEPLRRALESKTLAGWRDDARGVSGCVLPVQGAAEISALIALETPSELDRERVALIVGMLRIYRSHLAALDYGDVDELTRLANRRTFDDQFRRLASIEPKRRRTHRLEDVPGARTHLAVADIDHFKQVNDRFGHPYGDEVLVLFAGLMRQTFRDTDRLFRFGGEEFVILLTNCGMEDALHALERFRVAVGAFPFPQLRQVTVSVGVSSVKLDDTGSAAFGRADQALYVAKRSGRNRVLQYEALRGDPALDRRQRVSPDVELF